MYLQHKFKMQIKLPSPLIRILFVLIASIAGSSFYAATVSLEPSKDNTIFSISTDESNGLGRYLFVGTTKEPSLRRSLIQFDLSGSVPQGATIESATLTLQMNKSIVGAMQINLHKLTRDWGEGTSNASGQEGKGASASSGDATWLRAFYPDDGWSSGGDFLSTVSASQSVGGPGSYSWTGAGLVNDLQNWANNPSANFGWILIGPESETSAKRFDSLQATTASNRPMLSITYSESAQTWAGYAVSPDGRSVDTESFLGWIDVETAPWIYVYAIDGYMYLPEESVGDAGGWSYTLK